MPKMRSSDVKLTRIIILSSSSRTDVFTDVLTTTGCITTNPHLTLYNAAYRQTAWHGGGVPPELDVNMQYTLDLPPQIVSYFY